VTYQQPPTGDSTPQPPAPPAGYQPPPPGYGPPPAGSPVAQPPSKKKKKWPWIVLAIVVVMILGCAGVFAIVAKGAKDAVDTLDDNASGKNAVAGTMNAPARDGKFEFTVTKLECGKTSVGDSILAEKAQGQFCIVSLTVKNIGKEAQTFDGSSQKAYDAKNTQYSNDTAAELAINNNSQTFLEQINPGNSVKGQLVFDVPKGTKLTSIELHDSFLSGGVKIPLK
jgi:hypothetical protein